MSLSIFVPLAYISALVISMILFSKYYRNKTLMALSESSSTWFPEGHLERDIYQSLVGASEKAKQHVESITDPKEKEAAKKSLESLEIPLKAALLNRAMTDVRRILKMRDDKSALQTLLQKGSIGDDTMKKFGMAEKELEAEILDVVSEANTFREGWGQLIFPTASEMVNHLKHKEVYYDIAKQREEEARKLTEAGKPLPKPTIDLPPLQTPPGTQINVQVPGTNEAGGASSSSNGSTTTLSVSAPTESSPGIPQGPQAIPTSLMNGSPSPSPLAPQVVQGQPNPQQMQQMIFQAVLASQIEPTGPNGQPTQSDVEKARDQANAMLQAASNGDTNAQESVKNAVSQFQAMLKARAQAQANAAASANGSANENKENKQGAA